MVIETLRCQHLGQLTLLARALLDLSPFVLEPDLDLVFIETQLVGKILSPLLSEVSILLKLPLEPGQLV